MIYEFKNSTNNETIVIERGVDFNWPAHFHGSFELITVTEGEMTVTVDKKPYTVTPQNAILIFPNQIHSLSTDRHSAHVLYIFSPTLVRAYQKVFSKKIPLTPLFCPDGFYVDCLHRLSAEDSLLTVKGLLYSVCAQFDKEAHYTEQVLRDNGLLLRIFSFVEANYAKDCSLSALARHTTYNGAYLSRYFKQYTGLNYIDHVNRFRITEASYLLSNTDKKILDIAFECGFDSLRSFNRNFKALTGITPKEYRNT